MKTLVTTKMIDDAKQRLKIIKTNLKHHILSSEHYSVKDLQGKNI
jgi:hypothetical protein